jgi:hypothetical protein
MTGTTQVHKQKTETKQKHTSQMWALRQQPTKVISGSNKILTQKQII